MSEKDFEAMAKEAAEYIKKLAPDFTPKIALTLGSGCGDVANEIVPVCQVEYGKLPGFPVSSVQGHAGVLILGHLAGVPIIGLKGRVHYYEGNPRSMVVPVYTMKLLGAEHIFITNASGSLRQEMGPGALVALTDHMNFSGVNPLIGANCDGMGPRFPSLYQAYDPKLRDTLMQVATDNKIKVHQGVYVGTSGPSFETAAEINAYRIMGGDVVGMSTVGEVRVCHGEEDR
jgi:xanthosine phosphorylase